MLKAVPNKNAGFIILFTSIFILFYFMRSLSMSFYFIIKTSSRFNGFYLCFWFLSLFSFIWIGGQFPVDNFLSYGRILTLHYYLLIFWVRSSFPPTVGHVFPSTNSSYNKALEGESHYDRGFTGDYSGHLAHNYYLIFWFYLS